MLPSLLLPNHGVEDTEARVAKLTITKERKPEKFVSRELSVFDDFDPKPPVIVFDNIKYNSVESDDVLDDSAETLLQTKHSGFALPQEGEPRVVFVYLPEANEVTVKALIVVTTGRNPRTVFSITSAFATAGQIDSDYTSDVVDSVPYRDYLMQETRNAKETIDGLNRQLAQYKAIADSLRKRYENTPVLRAMGKPRQKNTQARDKQTRPKSTVPSEGTDDTEKTDVLIAELDSSSGEED